MLLGLDVGCWCLSFLVCCFGIKLVQFNGCLWVVLLFE